MSMRQHALDYWDVGLSPIPLVRASKKPARTWADFTKRRITRDEVAGFVKDHHDLAIVCGPFSGGADGIVLEVLDFESPEVAEAWSKLLLHAYAENDEAMYLVRQCPLVKTRRGWHLWYRFPLHAALHERGAILARNRFGEGLVEVLGNGHLCTAWPSKGYTLVRGDLTQIPVLPLELRNSLLGFAVEVGEPQPEKPSYGRPLEADSYDDVGMPWSTILEYHGWTACGHHYCDGRLVQRWTRPGGTPGEVHATTGAVGARLWVFSTNAQPFDVGKPYSKVVAYSMLNGISQREAAAFLGVKGGR